MINAVNIQCDITPTDPLAGLELEIWFNDLKVFDQPITEPQHFEYQLDDSLECEQQMKFVLKNKTDQHTKIDQAGNIVSDAMLEIRNIRFDEIDLGHMFYELSKYNHNFNGHGDAIEDNFYGHMGCNGTVSLKFTSPVYLWLLENM